MKFSRVLRFWFDKFSKTHSTHGSLIVSSEEKRESKSHNMLQRGHTFFHSHDCVCKPSLSFFDEMALHKHRQAPPHTLLLPHCGLRHGRAGAILRETTAIETDGQREQDFLLRNVIFALSTQRQTWSGGASPELCCKARSVRRVAEPKGLSAESVDNYSTTVSMLCSFPFLVFPFLFLGSS